MNRTLISCVALACAMTPPTTAQAPAARPVDLVLCLDTSNSMDGLIDSARQNLWSIVNDLALATPQPRLRVALLTYGSPGYDAARGWVNVATALTDDLDVVSMRLFGVTTHGGDEYVGRVLRTALDELDWDASADALRLMIVAGNESAAQDPDVDFRAVCADAASRAILVNSVYCGDAADGIAPGWREIASRADGAFASIAKDGGNVVVETPFDAELAELGAALSATYVAYGARGAWASSNQVEQDANAARTNPATAAQRAICKANPLYSCASWDLVDAIAKAQVKLEDLKADDLPELLRGMSRDELRAHLDAKAAERAAIQQKVLALQAERDAFVTKELARRAGEADAAFEFAVRRAIRAQAEERGFVFRAVSATPATGAPEGSGLSSK